MRQIKHIIPGVNFKQGKHCYYSSIANVMAHSGVDLSEAEIFVLFGGFIMRYYCDAGKLDLTVNNEMPTDFIDKISSGIRYINEEGKNRDLEEIYEAISKDNLVLLAIQNKFLSYNKVYRESESYLHYILMYGYDKNTNQAHIADTFMLDHSGSASIYSGTMPLDNIKKGIGAFACFNIEDKNIISKEDFIDIFIKRFRTFLTHKLDESDQNIYLGNQAIRKYIENIFPAGDMDNALFEKSCLDAIYNLKFGVMLHLLEYLISILKKYHFMWNKYEDLISGLKVLKSDWHKYFIYLLKVAYSCRRDKISQTIKHGIDIFEYQEKVFFDILNTIYKMEKRSGL